MSSYAVAHACWSKHVNAVRTDPALRGWLTDRTSLTQKLIAHCDRFRVRRLRQERDLCLADEFAAIGLARRIQVRLREVLLECDGVPVVYAHTIVPLSANAYDWPFFGALGERSLGTTLFGDPRVGRGSLEYARLTERHPLVRRLRSILGDTFPEVLLARRCLYRRHKGLLLVTEVFLPSVMQLRAERIIGAR